MHTEMDNLEKPLRRSCRMGLLVAVCLTIGGWSCAHSESANESSSSETEKASRSDASEASNGEPTSSTSSTSEESSNDDSGGYKQRPRVKSLQAKTTRLEAQTEAVEVKSRLQHYYLTHDPHRLPDDLAALTESEKPLVKDEELLEDPWGNRYIYRKDGDRGVEVFSPGPDGEPGTEDDVRPSDD